MTRTTLDAISARRRQREPARSADTKDFPEALSQDSAADRGPEARAEERSRCRRPGRGALAKAGGVARCRGASGARSGEADCGATKERNTPAHGAMPEAVASPPLPTAARFLSGAPIADGASTLSTATPKKRSKRRRGCGTLQNKSPKAHEWRHTPHPRRSVRARPGTQWSEERAQ